VINGDRLDERKKEGNEKMKKGFTLIELLAVIIILAILMIIAVPNILNTLATARQNAFRTQAESIFKSAEQQFTINSMNNKYVTCYSKAATGNNAQYAKLDLGSLSSTVYYKVIVDSVTGKITYIKVVDTGQGFSMEQGTETGSNLPAVTMTQLQSATITTNVTASGITECVAN
jgi:type IV pilus assembly protein PilA